MASILPQGAVAAAQTVQRTSGPDRIETAVAASREHRSAASDALLVTATTYPDALAAGALAARLDAPLLLTRPDRLPDTVGDELERLGVDRVWLLGGTHAVSDRVARQLADRGLDVRRLEGDDRYETAAAVARQAGLGDTGEVVVALGSHPVASRAWPDGVAAGALAAAPGHVPTLLTAADELPAATELALAELEPSRVLLAGGPEAISAAVAGRISDRGFPVTRIAGANRYETSAALAAEALARFPDGSRPVVFATGEQFPDALSGGALAATLGGPIVLVPRRELAASVESFLRTHSARWQGGVVVGGPSAIDDWVVGQLEAALDDAPAPQRPSEPTPPADPDPPPAGPRVVSTFEGVASWYGPGFAGNITACGERFDPRALTAAHRTLACGTRVRVTNLRNNRQVTVRINDRGPFTAGRILDVSERAAEDLGFRTQGLTEVRGEVLAN